MVSRNELERYLNQLLEVHKILDYCPNGLQVEGCHSIKTIVTGVTACKALLEKAIEYQADAVLVHHGFFWKNESACLTGMKYKRLSILFSHQINLFAYHLPLDIHLQYGNNVQLAALLDFEIKGQSMIDGLPLVFFGQTASPVSVQDFSLHLQQRLQREPLCIEGREGLKIQKVAWCTGAAQRFIEEAYRLGVDAYITGEVSESTTHLARELGIHFFSCGHHATERYGVRALGAHLAEQFGLQHYFVEIENPV